MESMLGFRQDLGFAGSVQSVAAVAIHPEITGSAGEEGLTEAAARTWETMHLGDEFDIEVGSTEVVGASVRAIAEDGGRGPALCFSGLARRKFYRRLPGCDLPAGCDSVRRRRQAAGMDARVLSRNGGLMVERGLHQEIGWERRTDVSGMSVRVYSDSIRNPVLEAMEHMAAGAMPVDALVDCASGLLRAAGTKFSSQGVMASVDRRLPGGNDVRSAMPMAMRW